MTKKIILFIIVILFSFSTATGQEFSTGLKEIPDRLQESFAQAQPAGLITVEGGSPGSGGDDTATLPSRVDLSEYLPPCKKSGRNRKLRGLVIHILRPDLA